MNIDLKPSRKTIYYSIPVQLFMIYNIKKPILEGMETIFNPWAPAATKWKATRQVWKALKAIQKLPEPTIERTWHPNTHNLIKLRDWLFECCFPGWLKIGFIRKPIKFIRGLVNFPIILYDFDPPWRWIIDNFKDEALKMEWLPGNYRHNLKKLRDWLVEHCFLDKQRMDLIRRLISLAILLYYIFPPWRWIVAGARDEALKMEWKPKNPEDFWRYEWWKE